MWQVPSKISRYSSSPRLYRDRLVQLGRARFHTCTHPAKHVPVHPQAVPVHTAAVPVQTHAVPVHLQPLYDEEAACWPGLLLGSGPFRIDTAKAEYGTVTDTEVQRIRRTMYDVVDVILQ